MFVTYKYRLKDRASSKRLREMSAACNQVWNWCVAQQRDIEARYKAGAKSRKWATHYDLQILNKGIGKELSIHQQTVGSVCEQFSKSRNKNKRTPHFRSSFGSRRALGWVPFQQQSRRIDGNSIIYLGKRYRWFGNKRRPLPQVAKGGTFAEDTLGRWWVCFQLEVSAKPVNATARIGIDLGLKSFATLSDGRKIEAPQIYREYERKLAVTQRARNKRRAKMIHAKIVNCRKDFLHKLSTALVREHALIAVGNVSSSKLVRTMMAKSIIDAGWSAFRSQLQYKSQQAGVVYLEVDEKFSSVTCSSCAARSGPQGQKGLRIREWICSECGAVHDRDTNAAKNILVWSTPRLVGESRVAI